MQRVVPPPPPTPAPAYPAQQTVMRLISSAPSDFIAYFTGNMQMWVTRNGATEAGTLGPEFSGTQIQTDPYQPLDAGSDIIIEGAITQLDVYDNNTDFVAAGNTLNSLAVVSSVKTLDLRNADNLQSIGYVPFNIETLYAKATTTDLRNICTTVLQNSPTGGTMFIDDTDTYAAAVKTVAQAQGWNVYSL